MEFKNYKELKDFVFNAYNRSSTPQDFENWCNENAYKHSIKGQNDLFGEPALIDATELSLCI